MKKGYTETLPLDSHDNSGLPVWGPQEEKDKAKARRLNKREHVSQREQARADAFKRNADKPVQWHQNIRTAGNHTASYDYINLEGVYRGFRERLVSDPAFEHQILELILDRIMSELFVPLNHRPQAGLKLKICRKVRADEPRPT